MGRIKRRMDCSFVLCLTAVLFSMQAGCTQRTAEKGRADEMKIIFLHHSTGGVIWNAGVKEWFKKYRSGTGARYDIEEIEFPRRSPYGWKNYPYDYWNIWVEHAGSERYLGEPTLEILTEKYDVIVWKHCFPVSDIAPDTGSPDVASEAKRLENYKLQYLALREKMRSFPQTKFVVWTGAALVAGATDEERATRARDFFDWVRDEWDEKGDNVFLWDFYALETEGRLYLRDEYAAGPTDSHPNGGFAGRAAPLFCRRVVDAIEGRGDESPIGR